MYKWVNSIGNRFSADAALYQDTLTVLDEVSLHRRGIRGKYRWSPTCYFVALTLADSNTIRLLWARGREISRVSVLNENSFFLANLTIACFCPRAGGESKNSNLVDPASSHTLVSKIKPCMSKYKGYIQWNCEWLIQTVIVYLIFKLIFLILV